MDSGAAINVLPYSLDIQLGSDWDPQTNAVEWSGNLAAVEARVVVVFVKIGTFSPLPMGISLARADTVPVFMGPVNILLEFDVCPFRSRSQFEVRPKQAP